MRRSTGVVLVAAAVVAGACGGGGSEEPTVADLVSQLQATNIGCIGFRFAAPPFDPGVRQQGGCEVSSGGEVVMSTGERVTIVVFDSNSSRDAARAASAGQAGGTAVVGDRWMIRAGNEDTAGRIADELDGDVG